MFPDEDDAYLQRVEATTAAQEAADGDEPAAQPNKKRRRASPPTETTTRSGAASGKPSEFDRRGMLRYTAFYLQAELSFKALVNIRYEWPCVSTVQFYLPRRNATS